MKYSKTLRLTVRVREFETVQIEVGAEISHFDFAMDDNELAAYTKRSPAAQTNLGVAMRTALDDEVEKLARTELEKISTWTEFSPNLADDYLGSKDGRTRTKKNPASPRRLTR
jgi:hypothetical protein